MPTRCVRTGAGAACRPVACDRYGPIVMVGDGVTDMQARPPADLFIGFGGIAQRPPVREGADWFITDFKVSRQTGR